MWVSGCQGKTIATLKMKEDSKQGKMWKAADGLEWMKAIKRIHRGKRVQGARCGWNGFFGYQSKFGCWRQGGYYL